MEIWTAPIKQAVIVMPLLGGLPVGLEAGTTVAFAVRKTGRAVDVLVTVNGELHHGWAHITGLDLPATAGLPQRVTIPEVKVDPLV